MISETTYRMTEDAFCPSNFDRSVSPGHDFYQFACGGWMKENPLPADKARFGTFTVLREQAKERLQDLILHLSESEDASVEGTDAQKVSDLYSMFMDQERINREGVPEVAAQTLRIKNMKRSELFKMLGDVDSPVYTALFGAGVGPDMADSTINILSIGDYGLGLGDRDYYLEVNDHQQKVMSAYEKYMKTILVLSGETEEDASRIWNNLIAFENEVAVHKISREERRDPANIYHIHTLEQLDTDYPNIGWTDFFDSINLHTESVNLAAPRFMKFLDRHLPTLSDQALKDILVAGFISSNVSLMGDDFDAASLEFNKVMYGVEEQPPRWQRAMAVATSMFGESIGRLYVEKYFPESHKRYMLELVENLRAALAAHISALPWMSDATKEKALAKLRSMSVKIGYPDKWKDYSTLRIDPSKSYFHNLQEATKWYILDNHARLGKPVDKDEWHMYPQTVNAYYSPLVNEICFPAAILQPPYFSPDADDACNYGAIGVVIGHEMTHGFDDQGRKFDADGNFREWWTPEDKERFDALAARLVAQFEEVEVAPGVKANGVYTLGENIADQGGLRVALSAYMDSRKITEIQSVLNDFKDESGFTALQRFYISYAHVWAQNIRDEEIIDATKSDQHSLGCNRVNVTLRNIQPFFHAFGIKDGDTLFRPESERVIIW